MQERIWENKLVNMSVMAFPSLAVKSLSGLNVCQAKCHQFTVLIHLSTKSLKGSDKLSKAKTDLGSEAMGISPVIQLVLEKLAHAMFLSIGLILSESTGHEAVRKR